MTKKLRDSIVKNAKTKADGKPADYADGEGLRLHVTTSGKYWHYRYRWDVKGKELSLGTYPTVSLKEARERHEEAKALSALGINPRSYRKQMKAAKAELNSRSFQAIALEWLARSLPTWSKSHAVRVQRYLEKDVFPALGVMQINEVKPADIIRVVQRVEARWAGDAARRVKQYIHQVYTYAVTLELAERNPAADIDNNIIFKPRTKKHFATLTDPVKIGQLLRDMDDYQGSLVVRSALCLSPLVLLRPGELRAAEWSEIDLDQSIWTIPIKRMKAPTHIKQANQSVHIVPLSHQAVAIFKELHSYTGKFKYVFPSARGVSRPLSDNGVRVALRTMGYDNQMITPHGFRGMASSLLNELGWKPDAIERQLAHKEANQIRAAYNRAEYLEERREMLQAWADYLDSLRVGGQILTFRKVK
jgi:integrase